MGDPDMTGYEPMMICTQSSCLAAYYRGVEDKEGDPCPVCGYYVVEVDFEGTHAE